jgi:hypothetical protein
MSNLQTVRGNVVTWTIQFLDNDGNPVYPVSATLTIAYRTASGPQKVTNTMAPPAGNAPYVFSWDSSPGDPGEVDWYAKASGPTAAAAGCFTLTQNAAGPAV